MQFAMIDQVRVEAFKGGRGVCEICGKAAIAKCGPRIIRHWAHISDRDCDSWHENETAWHREWKSYFPEDCREKPYYADDGEVHRADIVTPTGIFVEVQNSPLSDVERQSRENFYKNLVWVVNGSHFSARFHILHALPDPTSDIAKDLVWYKARRQSAVGGAYWRHSENPDAFENSTGLVQVHSLDSIKNEVWTCYSGHHQFDWINPREGWLDAKVPVFFDFGDGWVWHLLQYDKRGLRCVRRTAKAKLLHDLMHEADASKVATRFYPVK